MMFGRRLTLFTLFGFGIRVDASWLALAALILWSLGGVYFPAVMPALPSVLHWVMAVAGLLGLMASLVVHEMAHALVARSYGLPIGGITLFLFGGVAELEAEPETPATEILMAAAGPAMSLALAVLAYGGAMVADGWAGPVLAYLGVVNLMLAGFNLVPAFPMDGGRMLRAALWAWRGDLDWATRMASVAGMALGLVVMAVGLWQLVEGNYAGGLWWMLIGLFIRMSAAHSYLVRRPVIADASIAKNS